MNEYFLDLGIPADRDVTLNAYIRSKYLFGNCENDIRTQIGAMMIIVISQELIRGKLLLEGECVIWGMKII